MGLALFLDFLNGCVVNAIFRLETLHPGLLSDKSGFDGSQKFFKSWTSQLFRLTRAKKILILPSKKNVLTVQPLPSDIKWYSDTWLSSRVASLHHHSLEIQETHSPSMIWLTTFVNIAIRISVPQNGYPNFGGTLRPRGPGQLVIMWHQEGSASSVGDRRGNFSCKNMEKCQPTR